jgi:RNA:NAD 2'-phosphotransferase (TPT1/KptA family)
MSKILAEKSKVLAFILRHRPDSIGLNLYEDAWENSGTSYLFQRQFPQK